MANYDTEPPDEIQYRRPDIIQWWVNDFQGQPMDENMIHRYISESPFFDWESKNGLLLDQARTNIDTFYMVNNRKAFEANLKNRSGVEFLIVAEPQPVADKELAAQGVTTGIWVIRKQDRQPAPRQPRVRPPHILVEKGPDGQDRWELDILRTYFIVGESVYQAPSVFDVVGNRLLSAATSLHKFFDIADGLPRFTPAMGHHYLPPRTNKPTNSSGSLPGTPSRSREGSIAPVEDNRSLRSTSVNGASQVTNAAQNATAKDSKLLLESLVLTLNYGDEFTDENPLTGEPGNLRFTASTAAVKKRRADEEAAIAKAKAEQESSSVSRIATPKAEKPPPPPSIFTTESKATLKSEKSNKDERKQNKAERKRRKSRHGGTATSPTTPSSATTPQAANPLS